MTHGALMVLYLSEHRVLVTSAAGSTPDGGVADGVLLLHRQIGWSQQYCM